MENEGEPVSNKCIISAEILYFRNDGKREPCFSGENSILKNSFGLFYYP